VLGGRKCVRFSEITERAGLGCGEKGPEREKGTRNSRLDIEPLKEGRAPPPTDQGSRKTH